MLPADRKLDGVSWMPLLKGENLVRHDTEPFFYYNCENLQAIRYGDWKLHLPRSQEQVPFWEKNKAFFSLTQPVLYNLRTDRGESQDVAAENPEIVQQMLRTAKLTREELGEYMRRGSGQRPTGSAIPHAPIISTGKDWQTVDTATRTATQVERLKRHPASASAGMKKANKKKQNANSPKGRKKS